MVRKSLLAGAALLLAGAAGAQLPPAQDAITQPVPDAAPNFVPYGAPIDLADANKLVVSALAEAKKHDWKLACAVVEPTGELVAYQKMDDTQYGSVETSIAKAKAAALYRRPTKVFADAIKAGNNGVLSLPGAISIEGGFPIVHGGKLIGGLGCSGAASNQDATAVYKALEEFK
jgi:glc operon protein GlcG